MLVLNLIKAFVNADRGDRIHWVMGLGEGRSKASNENVLHSQLFNPGLKGKS